MEERIFHLENEEFIRLGDLLKAMSLVGSGGQAKIVIQEGKVKVDGQVCLMRGAKIRRGQVLEFDGKSIRVE